MGFLNDIISAQRYRKKESVTPEEFLDSIQRDIGRDVDPESSLFFRHHPITVNLLNKILAGLLKKSGDKKDGLVIQALIAEMTEYIPNSTTLRVDSPTLMVDVVEEFTKTYKDAGNIISQALALFLKLK